jgi:hypothetical protein
LEAFFKGRFTNCFKGSLKACKYIKAESKGRYENFLADF